MKNNMRELVLYGLLTGLNFEMSWSETGRIGFVFSMLCGMFGGLTIYEAVRLAVINAGERLHSTRTSGLLS